MEDDSRMLKFGHKHNQDLFAEPKPITFNNPFSADSENFIAKNKKAMMAKEKPSLQLER